MDARRFMTRAVARLHPGPLERHAASKLEPGSGRVAHAARATTPISVIRKISARYTFPGTRHRTATRRAPCPSRSRSPVPSASARSARPPAPRDAARPTAASGASPRPPARAHRIFHPEPASSIHPTPRSRRASPSRRPAIPASFHRVATPTRRRTTHLPIPPLPSHPHPLFAAPPRSSPARPTATPLPWRTRTPPRPPRRAGSSAATRPPRLLAPPRSARDPTPTPPAPPASRSSPSNSAPRTPSRASPRLTPTRMQGRASPNWSPATSPPSSSSPPSVVETTAREC